MNVKIINQRDARDISAWKYQAPYDLYNMDDDAETIEELLHYQGIFQDEQLIGFFCTGEYAQIPIGHTQGAYADSNSVVDLGIGMRPDLTGQGMGFEFLTFILQEIKHQYSPATIRLSVAAFNKRAIQLYNSVGFETQSSFIAHDRKFWVMTKRLV